MNKEKLISKIFSILSLVFAILTLVGGYLVITHNQIMLDIQLYQCYLHYHLVYYIEITKKIKSNTNYNLQSRSMSTFSFD